MTSLGGIPPSGLAVPVPLFRDLGRLSTHIQLLECGCTSIVDLLGVLVDLMDPLAASGTYYGR